MLCYATQLTTTLRHFRRRNGPNILVFQSQVKVQKTMKDLFLCCTYCIHKSQMQTNWRILNSCENFCTGVVRRTKLRAYIILSGTKAILHHPNYFRLKTNPHKQISSVLKPTHFTTIYIRADFNILSIFISQFSCTIKPHVVTILLLKQLH